MKKQILIGLILINLILTMNAQTWSGATPGNIYYNQGKVGIGVANPNYTLEIGGTGTGSGIFITTGDEAFVGWYDRILKGLSNSWGWYAYNGVTRLYDNLNHKDRLTISNNGKIGVGVSNPQWNFEVGGTGLGTGIIMATGDEAFVGWYDRTLKSSNVNNEWGWYASGGSTYLWDNLNNINRLTITNTGFVGIGTNNPAYKLDVLGTIRAKEVKVDLLGADFVFEPTYKLRTLCEVETFIKQHKHLPDISPATDMQTNGANLGDMQTKLLQKLEESTLYLIELAKQIETLKKENQEIRVEKDKQLEMVLELKKEVELLKNK